MVPSGISALRSRDRGSRMLVPELVIVSRMDMRISGFLAQIPRRILTQVGGQEMVEALATGNDSHSLSPYTSYFRDVRF